MIAKKERLPSAEEIKAAAKARGWESVLSRYIPADLLDGKQHPCPVCRGNTRFSAMKDFRETGAVHCTKCGGKSDGIATVAWITCNDDQGEAMRQLVAQLGLEMVSGGKFEQDSIDIIAEVARDKSMPLAAFKRFNPEPHIRGRGKRFCARVPVYSERLERCGWFDIDPGGKGKFGAKDSHGLFIEHDIDGKPIAPQPGEIVCIVEGVKDAAALVGLGYKAIGLPTSYMAERFAHVFKGCHVIIVPDRDQAAVNGQYRTGGTLQGIAASVKVAQLPGELKASGGDDVRDVIKRHGEQAVHDAITNAEAWQPRHGECDQRDGRPDVYVTLNEGATAAQVINALGNLGWKSPWLPVELREHVKIYQRGGLLVSAVASVDPGRQGAVSIVPLPAAIIRERITQACQLLQEHQNKDGEIEVDCVQPPRWLYDSIHQRAWYGSAIRPLVGIIQAPTLRNDGSIIQNPGWDQPTGLLYRPQVEFPRIPFEPTNDDAKRAAADLLEVVADFPLQSDADRSAWLCMALTMIARDCIDGCVPAFTIDSNIRGSGKSLAADAASCIAYGKPAARRVFTRDDDEQRKVITTTAIEASPAVLLDNVDQQLGGAPLDAALTSRTWNDRVLGSSKTTGELPLRTVWTATGNNLSYGSDIARRVLPIRMMSPLESPEDRNDFKHPDLIGWVLANRPRLAVAALTILRAYFVAGRPEQPGGQWGSYEAWSKTIRGAVVWCGLADPLATRESAKASDDSRHLLELLIAGLQEADPEGKGVTCKEIERITSPRPDESPTCPALIEAVGIIAGSKKLSTRVLGNTLKRFENRRVGGFTIASRKGQGGVFRYFVTCVQSDSNAESQDLGGFSQNRVGLELVSNHQTNPNPSIKNQEETDLGGLSGLTSNPTRIENECVSHIHTYTHSAHTHIGAVGDGGFKTHQTHPTHSEAPVASRLCPSCGYPMTWAPAGSGHIEWDCSNCRHVIPERVEHEATSNPTA